ncbi:hypothetical protein KI387_002410 [Taxus chinensis]|uniref:Uncharacterized protein n=1 Tax=Taxus chinensis TaxID=29808 RepID=A0AA38GYN4_TAXCH|nr:hypothetical protein KI387_002410 [Taxus chinensis]
MERAACHPLEQIQKSRAHRLCLQLWENEELILNRRIEQKETRCRNIQSEIYQLLGFYVVFQGVVLTAVFQAAAQPNAKTCKCWWSPFILTAIALVGTVGAVHHKFHLQSEIQNQVEEEKDNSRALFRSIQQLRSEGAKFDLNAHSPRSIRRQETKGEGAWEWEWGCLCGYRGAITLILIVFSSISLLSSRHSVVSVCVADCLGRQCRNEISKKQPKTILRDSKADNGGCAHPMEGEIVIEENVEEDLLFEDMEEILIEPKEEEALEYFNLDMTSIGKAWGEEEENISLEKDVEVSEKVEFLCGQHIAVRSISVKERSLDRLNLDRNSDQVWRRRNTMKENLIEDNVEEHVVENMPEGVAVEKKLQQSDIAAEDENFTIEVCPSQDIEVEEERLQ